MISTLRPRTPSENSRSSSVCPMSRRRLARAGIGSRPLAATRSDEIAPPLRGPCRRSQGRLPPGATGCPTRPPRRPLQIEAVRDRSPHLRRRRYCEATREGCLVQRPSPVALLTPWASAITRLRLNDSTIGSSSSRMTSRIRCAELASASTRHCLSRTECPAPRAAPQRREEQVVPGPSCGRCLENGSPPRFRRRRHRRNGDRRQRGGGHRGCGLSRG